MDDDLQRKKLIVQVKESKKAKQVIRKYLSPMNKAFTIEPMFPESKPNRVAQIRFIHRGAGSVPHISKFWIISFMDPDVDVNALKSELAKISEFIEVRVEELPSPL